MKSIYCVLHGSEARKKRQAKPIQRCTIFPSLSLSHFVIRSLYYSLWFLLFFWFYFWYAIDRTRRHTHTQTHANTYKHKHSVFVFLSFHSVIVVELSFLLFPPKSSWSENETHLAKCEHFDSCFSKGKNVFMVVLNAFSFRFTIYKVHKASKKKREKSSAKKERKATKTLAIVLGKNRKIRVAFCVAISILFLLILFLVRSFSSHRSITLSSAISIFTLQSYEENWCWFG